MGNLLSDYSSLVDKQIPVNSDWDEELNEISFVRQQIHVHADRYDTDQVQLVDQKWQHLIAHAGEWEEEFTFPRDGFPRSFWWVWIDKFDSLSEEDKKTV